MHDDHSNSTRRGSDTVHASESERGAVAPRLGQPITGLVGTHRLMSIFWQSREADAAVVEGLVGMIGYCYVI